ncbi:MAG: hypothetical protein ACXVWF_07660 [Actinomycetota bacterium]
MHTTGMPAQIWFLFVPIVMAIGAVWYLGWNAVKSFTREEAAVIRLDPRRIDDREAA